VNQGSAGSRLGVTVVAAGFIGFGITWRKDVFGGASRAGSAEKELAGIHRARKARTKGWLPRGVVLQGT